MVSPASAEHAVDVGQMYRRHGAVVFRRILRFYSRDEAEEVLQEVFLKVLTTKATFRGDSAASTWLYQLATRHCLNRLRDANRRKELLAEHGEPAWGTGVSNAPQESRVFLEQLWDQLEPELAEIGVYYYVDGLAHGEIAKLVGVSRRTVGNRLARLQQIAEEAAGGVQ